MTRTPQQMAELASRGLAKGLTIEPPGIGRWWKVVFDGVVMGVGDTLVDAIFIGKQFKEIPERVECEPGHHQWQRVDPVAGYDFGCTRCGLGAQDDE